MKELRKRAKFDTKMTDLNMRMRNQLLRGEVDQFVSEGKMHPAQWIEDKRQFVEDGDEDEFKEDKEGYQEGKFENSGYMTVSRQSFSSHMPASNTQKFAS